MPSLSDYLRNNVLTTSEVVTAKASGALAKGINGVVGVVDNILSKLLGGAAKIASIGTTILTFAEQNVLRVDQQITATVLDPIKTPITSNTSSPTFANAASSSAVTSISPTQQNDLIVTPVGNEPPMAFRGQYPYVNTFKSESGHIREIDDTPGHERLLDYHRAGTYQEIDADGRRVLKVVGDDFVIIVGNDSIHIDGNRALYVRGSMNITCMNDVSINAGGRVEINSSDDLKLKAKSISLETTSGDINMYSSGGFNTQSQGNMNMYSRNKFNILAADTMSVAAVKTLSMGATEKASIQSRALIAMDAPIIASNKGLSVPLPAANSVIITKKTGLGSAPAREEVGIPSILEGVISGADDDSKTQEDAIKAAIAAGTITKAQIDSLNNKKYTVLESDNEKAATVRPVATTANEIKNLSETGISSQLKLSTNYNLCHLTDGGPVFKDTLVAQKGRTKAQIAGNLSLLAQNVLEPIARKFGPITINSAFRQGTGDSQHNKGMAVDITYGLRSTDPETMYEIAQWIKHNVAFDQLILEYGNKQIWTHVSFNGEGSQRGWDDSTKVMTCPRPSAGKYVSGLQLLSWTSS